MTAADSIFQRALINMLTELFNGPPGQEAYVLNPGDPGLLRQLDTIDARTASARATPGQTTIAAQVDHVTFGFNVLNRWFAGEPDPFAGADYSASWQRTNMSEEQWRALRGRLRHETEQWQKAVSARNEWDNTTASAALSTAAHTAYHIGAIRQMLIALSPGR